LCHPSQPVHGELGGALAAVAEIRPLLRTFSYHYRCKFGHGVGKIPLDLHYPCPNRRQGGCIFCRPAGFTPEYLRDNTDLAEQLAAGKKHHLKGRFKKYFAYFQQETCTAVPSSELLPLLRGVVAEGDCIGLILSTRPDYVADDLLHSLADLVRSAGKECLFELGVQSVHEKSLRLLNRNHGFAAFQDAASRILACGCFELGAHLLFGIPGENEGDMLVSLKTICAMGVNHLKLHQLQVMRDTPLERLHARGEVKLFSLEGYLQFLLHAVPIIPSAVTLHRLWATAHPEFLLAPRWHRPASELSILLQRRMVEAGVFQGQAVVGG